MILIEVLACRMPDFSGLPRTLNLERTSKGPFHLPILNRTNCDAITCPQTNGGMREARSDGRRAAGRPESSMQCSLDNLSVLDSSSWSCGLLVTCANWSVLWTHWSQCACSLMWAYCTYHKTGPTADAILLIKPLIQSIVYTILSSTRELSMQYDKLAPMVVQRPTMVLSEHPMLCLYGEEVQVLLPMHGRLVLTSVRSTEHCSRMFHAMQKLSWFPWSYYGMQNTHCVTGHLASTRSSTIVHYKYTIGLRQFSDR